MQGFSWESTALECMDISVISIELYRNILNDCTKQHIYANQSQSESHDHNITMIISWLWHHSPMDSSTLIPTISQPFTIKFAYMFADFLLRFVCKASCFHFSLSRVCTHSMKFDYIRGSNVGFFLHKSKNLQLVPRKKNEAGRTLASKVKWKCLIIMF